MKTGIKVMAAALVVVLAGVMTAGCGGRSGEIVFGTAKKGGVYDRFGQAFTEAAKDSGIKIRTKKTAGSAANIRLIDDNYIQLAIAQNDIIDDAYNGRGVFSGDSKDAYRAVAALYTEKCQLVVRADSDIESVSDLEDKTVSVGEDESGTEQNANQILAAYGLSASDYKAVNDSYQEAVSDLKSGDIDAFFVTAGVPNDAVSDLADEIDIRLVPLDETHIRRLMRAHEFYTSTVIPAGSYKGQKKDVETIGVRSVLIVNKSVKKSTVKKLTETLFDNREKIEKELGVKLEIDENSVSDVTIPFHEGAAEYYSSKGISVKTE
ncbi:MAG: TAXI family TRAP transporter solute-binding subunit [Anaerovoracaceae bacterium]